MLKKCITVVLILIFSWFIIHILIISIDGLNDDTDTSDAAVVLGNTVEADGKPSKRLQGRLDRAVELYNEGRFKYVIVSGGTGKEGHSEAIAMKDYLIEKGVPQENILLDQEGYNTLMTAQNTKTIMDNKDLTSVTIISQFFHISRTKLAFGKVGVKHISSAHAKYFELRDAYSLFREFFAYYKYLLLY